MVTRPVQAYGYGHWETTGLTDVLLVDGRSAAIRFRFDSNPMAVQSLMYLQNRILMENDDGKSIFVVGQWYDGVSTTPCGPATAACEPYHEFTLKRWYILTPFREATNWEASQHSPGDVPLHITSRANLKRSDFAAFPGREHLSLTALEHPR